jgi:hypothetical protein
MRTKRSIPRALRTVGSVVLTASAIIAFAPGAGTASADDGPWAACSSGSTSDCKAGQAWSARGRTIDAENWACVDDVLADGRSAVLVVWPAGQYERRREVWEARGVGNGYCVNIRDWLDVPENKLLGYKACIGESGPMTIVSCGAVRTATI